MRKSLLWLVALVGSACGEMSATPADLAYVGTHDLAWAGDLRTPDLVRPHDLTTPSDLTPGASGCGQPATAGVQTATLVVDGVKREYLLVVPAGYDPAHAYPIVFGWHGLTWTASSFRDAAGLEPLAKDTAIFVYPQGLDVTGLPVDAAGGQKGYGWDWRPTGRDVRLYDELLKALGGKLCLDRSHVFSFGRSHGGFFTHALACFRGDTLRAVADTIGGKPTTVANAKSCTTSVPIWIEHASDDTTVPVALAEAARDLWVEENGCTAPAQATSPSPCLRYACASGDDVVWCLAPSGGHNPAPYAASAIWSFFAATF